MAFFNKKGNKVKFYGFIEHRKELNNKSEYIVTKRLMELIGLTAILVLILIFRLGYIQMTQSEKLAVKLDTYGSKTYYTDAPRGEIYDRNYTKLVENQNVICVNYFAPQSISENEITRIAKFLSQNITIDFSKNNINNITTRNIKEFFIMANEDIADSLISDEEDKELKEEYTDSSSYEKAKLNTETDEEVTNALVYFEDVNTGESDEFSMEYIVTSDGYIYSEGSIEDLAETLNERMSHPELYASSKISTNKSIFGADIEDEDDPDAMTPGEYMDDSKGFEDTLDDVADTVDDIQDQLDDVEEEDVDIEMDNNITNHYVAECDRCHGVFISVVVESDQEIDKISGVCPLCDKETDQYLKWIIRDVNTED